MWGYSQLCKDFWFMSKNYQHFFIGLTHCKQILILFCCWCNVVDVGLFGLREFWKVSVVLIVDRQFLTFLLTQHFWKAKPDGKPEWKAKLYKSPQDPWVLCSVCQLCELHELTWKQMRSGLKATITGKSVFQNLESSYLTDGFSQQRRHHRKASEEHVAFAVNQIRQEYYSSSTFISVSERWVSASWLRRRPAWSWSARGGRGKK